jgi:peptide/nickel transport system permease protein
LLRKLAETVSVIAGVVVAVFLLMRIIPGDPGRMMLGERATPEAVAELDHELGLDLPIWEQFWAFLTRVFTQGDTGTSLKYGLPSRDLILSRVPITLTLVLLAIAIAATVSVVLATLAATHKDTWIDHLVRALPTVGLGFPAFWVGILLIMVFAVGLGWFRVGGIGEGPGEPLRSLILPATTVAIAEVPSLVRSLRSQLLDVLRAPFVVTLQAAGLPRRAIMFKHVLRNAAVPTLVLLGVNTAYLVGGTLVIERVFAINGLGSLLFTAISNRDFPVVQGIALYCATAVVVVTLVVELIARRLDPRMAVK